MEADRKEGAMDVHAMNAWGALWMNLLLIAWIVALLVLLSSAGVGGPRR